MSFRSAINKNRQLGRIYSQISILLILGSSVLLSGCMSVKQYVDPKLPKVSYADLKPVADKQAVQVFLEYQTNGSTNAKATEAVRPIIVDTMNKSGLFDGVKISPETADRKLYITINNFPVTKDASSKGFVTGLTFGLAGSMVTDGFLMNVSYVVPGQPEAKHSYKHALHSTIGNADGPPGLEPVPKGQAIKQVVEGLMLNMLNDLDRAGELK